ncbi:MAG: hypothetical protein HC882_02205 [Acidobacteria bacterium]|nr:hypothetical protein [Acidobacteriota bacterium]
MNVCTNGWLSFTSTLTSYSNQPLPNTGSTSPENMIAAFWDDLHFRTTGKAYTYNDGTRFIVQWTDVERLSSGSLLTFQVILYPNGNVELQYGRMTGLLDSATIGIQNATKDDGLTVAFNAAYMHSDLAVRFSRIPEWVVMDPTEGTVPEDLFQDVELSLDSVGLEDGIHEATIQIQSNDPYNPLVTVPVRLNVSLIEPTLTAFNPKVLRLGNTDVLRVRMKIELPAELDPHAIRLSSVMLNDSVPALASPAPYYTDDNLNGIEEVTFWFDAEVLRSTLGEGTEIPVTIMGEVEDVQWWRGMDTVRTGDPDQVRPVGGEYNLAGTSMPIEWNPASSTLQRYTVELTRDGGAMWEMLATGLETTRFDWTVSGALTENALIRVTSYDQLGNLLGADVTDSAFTIAGGTLLRPRPINGSELQVVFDGVTVELLWKAPSGDLEHGPADRFRVLRGTNPQMLGEVGVAGEERWTEEGSATAGEAMIYWTIIAANAAGDAGP